MNPKNLVLPFALGGAVFGTAAVIFLPASQVILGLCGVALLIAVLFFWNSLRTLGGDTDIPDEARRAIEHGPLEAMLARKKMLLLSLKDLDNERKLGKILPADFEDVSYRYREEVKALMRQIDAAAEPYRARAEEVANKHLHEQGLMPRDDQKASIDAEQATVRVSEAREDEQDDSSSQLSDADSDEPVDSRAITKPNAPPVPRASTRPTAPYDANRAGKADDKGDKADKDGKDTRPTAELLLSTKKSLHLDPSKLEADAGRRMCPSCNASNEPDAKFCKECATPLKKTESTAPKKPADDGGPATPRSAEMPAAKETPMENASADAPAKTEGATDA